MYVKVFESRKSSNSYIIQHDISIRGLDHGKMYIENQNKIRLTISENELFYVIDKFFKDKLNEKSGVKVPEKENSDTTNG